MDDVNCNQITDIDHIKKLLGTTESQYILGFLLGMSEKNMKSLKNSKKYELFKDWNPENALKKCRIMIHLHGMHIWNMYMLD